MTKINFMPSINSTTVLLAGCLLSLCIPLSLIISTSAEGITLADYLPLTIICFFIILLCVFIEYISSKEKKITLFGRLLRIIFIAIAYYYFTVNLGVIIFAANHYKIDGQINLSQIDNAICGNVPEQNTELTPYHINHEQHTITVLCPLSWTNFFYKTDTIKSPSWLR